MTHNHGIEGTFVKKIILLRSPLLVTASFCVELRQHGRLRQSIASNYDALMAWDTYRVSCTIVNYVVMRQAMQFYQINKNE